MNPGSTTSGTRRIRIGLAVVVFLVSVVAFDRIFFAAFELTHVSFDTRPELRKKLESLPDKQQHELLILGTSRTFEAVHPAYISKALGIKSYKEAYRGKGPRYNYEFYQLYERVVGRPKWVVYGVDYFLFEMTSDQWAMDRFNVRVDAAGDGLARKGLLLTLANKSTNDRAIVRTLEEVQKRRLPSAEFSPETNVNDMDAYLGAPVIQPTGREAPVRFDPKGFGPYPGHEGRYFAKLLEQWDAEGVRVMLIYTPDYIRTHEMNYEHDRCVACFRELIAHHRNAVFVDYSDPRRFPLDRATYFAEGGLPILSTNSHLSRHGVVEFNKLFIPDLKRFTGAQRAR